MFFFRNRDNLWKANVCFFPPEKPGKPVSDAACARIRGKRGKLHSKTTPGWGKTALQDNPRLGVRMGGGLAANPGN